MLVYIAAVAYLLLVLFGWALCRAAAGGDRAIRVSRRRDLRGGRW